MRDDNLHLEFIKDADVKQALYQANCHRLSQRKQVAKELNQPAHFCWFVLERHHAGSSSVGRDCTKFSHSTCSFSQMSEHTGLKTC